MGIIVFDPPPSPADEIRRERAVEASGALLARDDAVLCDIAVEARTRFRASTAAVAIMHGDYQHLIAASGMATGMYARRTSLCGHAVAEGEPVFQLPDVAADRRFTGNPWVNGDVADVSFYAGALLCNADGLALGTLCVTDVKSREPLTAAENADLRRLADLAIDRLEHLRRAA